MKTKIAWDIKIREIDNGLIVMVENQNNMRYHKFYCTDITGALKEVNERLKRKQEENK